MSTEFAERLAHAVLELFGIPPKPPIPLDSLARGLGVEEITVCEMVEDGRLELRQGRKLIFLRADTRRQRQRFTLAHELCHLILAEPDRDLVAHRHEVRFNSEERFCDQFAAALLMPRGWVQEEFKGAPMRIGVARNLAGQAGVSLSASFVRLREAAGWQGSLLHWRRLRDEWRLTSTAGLPHRLHNRVASNRDTRAVLEQLAGSEAELRGMLPIEVGGQAGRVPVEIAVGERSAVALAKF